MSKRTAIALFCVCAMSASVFAQNFLQNSSFEVPVVAAGAFTRFYSGDTIGAGWIVDSAAVDAAVIDRGYQGGSATWYAPTDGNQYLYVGDIASVSVIHQDVLLTTIGSHRLTFDLANFAASPFPGGARLTVDVINVASGVSVCGGAHVFTRPLGGGYAQEQLDLNVVQTGAHRLSLESANGFGCNVDNFVLISTPRTGLVYCLGDGTGTACPCGNASPVGTNAGCLNSSGVGGKLTASGTPSIASDSVQLSGSQMPDSPTLYFQGTTQVAGGSGTVFGDGLRCTGGTISRLGTKTNTAGSSQYPTAGDSSISVRGLVVVPGIRTYQAWYRNAASFCTPSTYNLTNGVQVTWVP